MNTVFLQAAGGQYQSIIMLVLMFGVIYFFMIRPQVKKQKAEKKFQSDINSGDKVVTTSGIHGKITDINDSTCVIETGAGRIKFERSSISLDLTNSTYGKVEK
ncbi:MAG: preprotein translocase subunit YajC [Ichthyobacteriaceae bacterium]|nr:preprotein translocase subunit YajC [Ichthyobacteriaceae bacterium]